MDTQTNTAKRESWQKFVQSFNSEANPEHRRKDKRFDVGFGHVELYTPPDATTPVSGGTLVNVSDTGMMVRQRCDFDEMHGEYARVRIVLDTEDGELTLYGTVAHNTPTVGGFKAGIELDFGD
jgi:hypothetical protein